MKKFREALRTSAVAGLLALGATTAACASVEPPQAEPAARQEQDDKACIETPAVPAKSGSGFRIHSEARNGCSAPTTFWLVRYEAGPSAWHTSTEVVLMPGKSASIDLPCRGTGSKVYRAIQFDPNMLFNKSTPRVEINC